MTPPMPAKPDPTTQQHAGGRPRILITSGPTWEPLDSVRYLGNRSSGKLGSALADVAAQSGFDVTLACGPMAARPQAKSVLVLPFETTASLEALLSERFPLCDVLVMAAAVADYRPVSKPEAGTKMRRSGARLTVELEATPDLLAACAQRRRADQLLVGFALEPRERMLASAASKLGRKGVDIIVANPLETMSADGIAATLLARRGLLANTDPLDGYEDRIESCSTPGSLPKSDFGAWLLAHLEHALGNLPRAHAPETTVRARPAPLQSKPGAVRPGAPRT